MELETNLKSSPLLLERDNLYLYLWNNLLENSETEPIQKIPRYQNIIIGKPWDNMENILTKLNFNSTAAVFQHETLPAV